LRKSNLAIARRKAASNLRFWSLRCGKELMELLILVWAVIGPFVVAYFAIGWAGKEIRECINFYFRGKQIYDDYSASSAGGKQ